MDEHVRSLSETFVILRAHGMKLNPENCAFGVGAGRFLGFMILEREIEVNPEKIQAIMEISPP